MKTKRVALVTGGAKRIGKEVALYLADKGYSIALHYNTSEKDAHETKVEIEQKNVSCVLFKIDLSNTKETSKLIQRVKEELGDIAILINSASEFNPVTIVNTDISLLERQTAINYHAPFILTKEYTRTHSNGLIINFTDARLRKTQTGSAAYTISKLALSMLTEISAKEFAPSFRSNAIAPGIVLPPPGKDEAYLTDLLDSVPLKRKAVLEEIMSIVQFFIDNKYITGQTIYLDGGQYL